MSSRSSLLKRAIVPLLAVAAAAALCAPAHAATASLPICQAYGSQEIEIEVKCTMTGDSRWNKAVFSASNNIYATSHTYDTFTDYGPADCYLSDSLSIPGSGTYNCSCECDGLEYDNTPWQAFTSTTSVTV